MKIISGVSESAWYLVSDPKHLAGYEVAGSGSIPRLSVNTQINPGTQNLKIKLALDFDNALTG